MGTKQKFESLDFQWRLEQDGDTVDNWDAEESVKLMIDSSEVAEIFGLDNAGCIDEEDEDYPKIKGDMQFVSRVLVNSKEMYCLLESINNHPYTALTFEHKAIIKDLLATINP